MALALASLVTIDARATPAALAADGQTTQVFTTVGSSLFDVPAGVTEVEITATGAAGGTCYNGEGGRGATVTAIVAVTPGSQLRVTVGGRGPDEPSCAAAGTPGGIGGGGDGGAGTVPQGDTGGGGGGGASVVSTGAGSPTSASALVVAGAGGGAAYGQAGGDAGSPGSHGGDSDAGAGGAGTQTGGGEGGSPAPGSVSTPALAGSAFTGGKGGGAGGGAVNASGGGGGGGGYFGGGGGGAGGDLTYSGAGGGGSSYVKAGGYVVDPGTPTDSAASVTIAYPPAYPLPTATITGPEPAATYVLGQTVPTSFGCAEAPGGPGLASCNDSHGTATDSGGTGTLDTTTAGSRTYTVTSTSTSGRVGTDTISYTVVYPPPAAQISAPTTGGSYVLGQTVPTTFSCTEGLGAPGLTSCNDSHGTVTVSGGTGTLDTTTPGSHTYTVTSTSSSGLTGTVSIRYSVQSPAPPTATITSPASGATYKLGQKVPSTFTCSEGKGGPGLASCIDSNHLATVNGGAGSLDTAAAGAQTYTVTATSGNGLRGTATISYTVTSAAVAIKTRRAAVSGGKGKVVVSCSGATVCRGTLTLARKKTVIATAAYSTTAGTDALIRVKLTSAGKALLRKAKKHRISARATATVAGGATARRSIALRVAG